MVQAVTPASLEVEAGGSKTQGLSGPQFGTILGHTVNETLSFGCNLFPEFCVPQAPSSVSELRVSITVCVHIYVYV